MVEPRQRPLSVRREEESMRVCRSENFGKKQDRRKDVPDKE